MGLGWRHGFNRLGDLLFPPVCVHCQGMIEESEYRYLCRDCGRRVDFVRPPVCETCGHPVSGAEPGGTVCVHCSGLAPAFGRGRTAVLFRGPARSLLIELKYRGGGFVLADIERIFRRSPAVLSHVRDAVLVPVPLHPRKHRERGFNQSALAGRGVVSCGGNGAASAAPAAVGGYADPDRLGPFKPPGEPEKCLCTCPGGRP